MRASQLTLQPHRIRPSAWINVGYELTENHNPGLSLLLTTADTDYTMLWGLIKLAFIALLHKTGCYEIAWLTNVMWHSVCTQHGVVQR